MEDIEIESTKPPVANDPLRSGLRKSKRSIPEPRS